jgi:tripartite-type tricarboxylate transporter receptor subunit TctC
MKSWLSKSKMSFFLSLLFILFATELGYTQEDEIHKYPSRPITYIMPFPPGNADDLAARLIAKEVEKFLGQPVVVLNKPGGTGTIGIATIASAKPDGYTIGHANSSGMFVLPHIQNLPYHPLKDLISIVQYGAFNMGVVVKAASPFKSFEDLIVYARQNPKKLTYGTLGTNNINHLIMQLISKKEKIEMTQMPYKGASEGQMSLLGGHILCVVGPFNYSLLEAGEIRLLLILQKEKSVEYPQTPCLKDFGYDFYEPSYLNVTGPKGIPAGIVKKIEEAYTKSMKKQVFIKGMKDLHYPIFYRSSKELGDYVAYNYGYWGRFLKEMGKN